MIDKLVASGALPDFLIRGGIRNYLEDRIEEISFDSVDEYEKYRSDILNEFKSGPIAIKTDEANDQHYQVPTEFFTYVLGKRMKYSCNFHHDGDSLDQAEERMLELIASRADLKDGHRILELGCGWGAISLFMAEKFPNSQIVAISNSKTQKEHIDARAKERGLNNLEVRTHNVAELQLNEKFDRVVSIEMFEHMRNYQALLKNINGWLNEGGKLFVHIFVHKESIYKFEVKDQSDWMSKYFFSGGTMPSEHMLYYFQDDMKVANHWRVSGTHYAETSRLWLENMDRNKSSIMKVFNEHYGKSEAKKWWNYWRVFFMSCEELWRYRNGQEWFVGHYLMEKNK